MNPNSSVKGNRQRQNTLRALGFFLWMMLSPTGLSQTFIQVYTNNMEGGVGLEWPNTTLATTATGRRFLGEFGSRSVPLRLANLPLHNTVVIAFDLFVLRTWDGSGPVEEGNGPDIFSVEDPTGNVLLRTTFASHEYTTGTGVYYRTQAYPGAYPEHSFPWNTGYREANTLAYSWMHPRSLTPRYNSDSVYRIVRAFDHSGETLNLDFIKRTLAGNDALDDESWGLDNVGVAVATLPNASGPIIVDHPADIRLSGEGDAAAMEVSVASRTPVSYQWFRNNTALSEATNRFYVIPNVTAEDLGDYSVVVGNDHGAVLSRVGRLIAEPPLVRIGPQSLRRNEGTAVISFSVFATGVGQLTYQWFHNENPLSNSGRITGANSPTLQIGNGLRMSDGGQYRVVVENSAGVTTGASATLEVVPRLPTIGLRRAVRPLFSNLIPGRIYQLQISTDSTNWTNAGEPFTAASAVMEYPNIWDVDNWERYFFQLQMAP